MANDPVDALWLERSELIGFCRDLTDADWRTPSAAPGWRVQDVVAHMGSSYRALFGPAVLEVMRSNDIERTNDVFVERRSAWPPSLTLSGPGGGCWVVRPDGGIQPGSPSGTAAQINGVALEFSEWGTQRASWRDGDVSVGGDADYGTRFLDAMNVV